MKKNITINLYGTLYNIDEDAYQLLERYLESMKSYFKRQEGGEEIADDIEHRVAELLWEKKEKEGMEAVIIETIKEIMEKIGNPADIGDYQEGTHHDSSQGTNAYRAAAQQAAADAKQGWEKTKGHFQGRHLYRDGSDKVLGGVCSGLARYFNTGDPVWWRLGLLLLFLCKGFGLLLYLVLWIVIPEARTPVDRLRMKGLEDNPENLNQELLREGYVSNSNGNGCLKALFFLIILGPLSILLLTICALAIGGLGVVTGLGAVAVAPLHHLVNSSIAWSGVIAVIVIICILLFLVFRLMRGEREPMKTWVTITLVVLLVGGTLWAIFAGAHAISHFIEEMSNYEHVNISVSDNNDTEEEDSTYVIYNDSVALEDSIVR